ncbi:MAG: phospholipase D-like domain-containing protein [Beijerinckiaceae bacterium]|jgi:phosphatidylserine/phosphatidylglycerophosphate/cardiolipin synthase-like enzyme|nr:phospholipase D-like domain-containing protein [Beijerinckiaceae bacterium]
MRRKPIAISRTNRKLLFSCLLLFFLGYIPSSARSPLDQERILGGIRHFFAPRDNLAEIDYALLKQANFRIDLAAYVLTDRGLISALVDAARRGVRIRIYLDPDQPAFKNSNRSFGFGDLLTEDKIEVRIKNGGRDLMHLKAYQVDGRILRTGAANFSYSGMRRQDNDLLVIESPRLAGQFISRFNFLWTRQGSEPLKNLP